MFHGTQQKKKFLLMSSRFFVDFSTFSQVLHGPFILPSFILFLRHCWYSKPHIPLRVNDVFWPFDSMSVCCHHLTHQVNLLGAILLPINKSCSCFQ